MTICYQHQLRLIYKKKLYNYVQLSPKTKLSFFPESQIPAQFDGEPVENLSKRHKADSKAKSTEAAKAGDEVQPSHLWQPRIFWKYIFIEIIFQILKMRLQLTIYCRFPKKDVHNCNVLFVGVVVYLVLIKIVLV